jgi:hypothetical protein
VPSWFSKVRFTVLAKPFCGVRVRVVWPGCPCWTVREVGSRKRSKEGGGLTVRLRVAVRSREPKAALIVRAWVPVGVLPVVEIVKACCTGPLPGTLTLVGLRETPAGGFTRERETVPAKPFWGVSVRVTWPEPPWTTAREVGFKARLKVGAGGEETVRVRGASRTRLPPVPRT